MFTKSTLKFAIPAALLFAGVSANAQVMLKDGTTRTWDQLATLLNSTSGSTADEDKIKELQSALEAAQTTLDNTSETTVGAADFLQKAVSDLKAYKLTYDAYMADGEAESPDQPTVWMKIATGRGSNAKRTLFLAFTSTKPVSTGNWATATVGDFYDQVTAEGVEKIDAVTLYFNENLQTVSVDTYEYSQANQEDVLNTVSKFLNNIVTNVTKEEYADYQAQVANPDYEEAQKAVDKAQAALDNAQMTGDSELLQTLYLTGDVNVTKSIMNFKGTLDGQGFVINVPASGAAFADFAGTLKNVAVNGTLARIQEEGAKFNNVAIWTGKTGNYYDADGKALGTTDKPLASVGAVAYADRNNYGVTDGKLAAVTEANKVYSITVYNTETGAPYFVTAADGAYTDLATNKAVTVAKNVFVKSADTDLEGVNVFYADGTAKQVEITDGVDFFCPEDITAESISYDRNFKEGHNSAYLPFAINSVNLDAQISTYNAEAAVENAFQFTYQDEAEAYTPMLLTVTEAGKLEGLSGVVKASSEAPALSGNGATGLLKKTVFNQVAGAGKTVWGLSNNKFLYGANGVQFPAFRMLIVTDATAAANEAPRKIVILDEYGQESGVDNVATDAAALEVVGGVGELTISTSADLGDVAIYSIDGRVAANVNAAAGITTVNLAKGVYIVMGKKVLVK